MEIMWIQVSLNIAGVTVALLWTGGSNFDINFWKAACVACGKG
jgi:hypothetical protein